MQANQICMHSEIGDVTYTLALTVIPNPARHSAKKTESAFASMQCFKLHTKPPRNTFPLGFLECRKQNPVISVVFVFDRNLSITASNSGSDALFVFPRSFKSA